MNDENEFEQVGIVKCPLCQNQNLSWNLECTWCGCALENEVDERNKNQCVA